MSSLVRELQHDALDGSVDVSALLRKAYAVAVKLKLDRFENWCQYELNGYPKGIEVPDYRHIEGQVTAYNPYNGGWHPVRFDECPDVGEQVCRQRLNGSIGQLQDLVGKGEKSGMLAIIFPLKLQHLILQGDYAFNQVRLEFGCTAIVKMLDVVRNIILDWSLRLEREGILGEGMSFSSHERQAATDHADRLERSIITIGTMINSTIQQGSSSASVGP